MEDENQNQNVQNQDSDGQDEFFERDTEAVLIEDVRNGKRESFRPLVITYQDRIFALIIRQVGDYEIAEELTQDTFLRAYRGLVNFQGNSKFSTWLTQIALNVTRSYFKSRHFQERRKTECLSSSTINKFESSYHQTDSIDREALSKINLLAQNLPEKLREVFTLCVFEQKPYAEVSEILEIPIGTVKSRLASAREIIRNAYFSKEQNQDE